MAVNVTRMRAVAERLIRENGRTFEITKLPQNSNLDSNKPWREPSSPAKASGSFTIDALGNASEGETVTIGSRVYTFTATVDAANEILIGLDRDDSIDNLVAAITNAAGEGTLYGTGTVEHADVIAIAGDPGEMVVTAILFGDVGNLIVTTTTLVDGQWEDVTLEGGLGTVFTVYGVFIDYDKEDFDGTLVRRGDKRLLVAAEAAEDIVGAPFSKLEDFDYLLDGAVRWKVIRINVIEPGGVRILYEIQARQ